jgi:hypothetical protein
MNAPSGEAITANGGPKISGSGRSGKFSGGFDQQWFGQNQAAIAP